MNNINFSISFSVNVLFITGSLWKRLSILECFLVFDQLKKNLKISFYVFAVFCKDQESIVESSRNTEHKPKKNKRNNQ